MPPYPESLRQAIDQAAHLAGALTGCRRAAQGTGETDGWVRERVKELHAFVLSVCDDWRRGVVTDIEASTALLRYLERVRSGAIERVTRANDASDQG